MTPIPPARIPVDYGTADGSVAAPIPAAEVGTPYYGEVADPGPAPGYAAPAPAAATPAPTPKVAAPAAPVAAPSYIHITDNHAPDADRGATLAGLEQRAFNHAGAGTGEQNTGPDDPDTLFHVGAHETEAAQEGYDRAHQLGVGIGPDYHFLDPKESAFNEGEKNIALENQQPVGVDAQGHLTSRPPVRWDDEGKQIAASERATQAQNAIMGAAVGGAAEVPNVVLTDSTGKQHSVPGTELEIRKFYEQDPAYAGKWAAGFREGDTGLNLKAEKEAKVQEALRQVQNAQALRQQILLNRLGIKQ